MKKCPLCETKMILRQYHTPVTRNVTGGTVSLPSEGSIDVFAWNTSFYSYWECPKCGYMEIIEGFSLPLEKERKG